VFFKDQGLLTIKVISSLKLDVSDIERFADQFAKPGLLDLVL
jgi:hypothetical protein